jgi:hypothetical protein
VLAGPFQAGPARLVDGLGAGTERGVGVHAEHELDLLGPPVEMVGEGEVGVAAQAHPFGVRDDEVDRLVDPGGSAGMAGGVAAPVDQVEHFLGVGQRHDQRRVPPDAL